VILKKLWQLLHSTFLFPLLIEIDVLLECLNFGNRESLLERNQDYGVAVEFLEFCFSGETGWREHSVRGIVVVVNNPAIFPPNVRSFLFH
jgi:hypothetical protein